MSAIETPSACRASSTRPGLWSAMRRNRTSWKSSGVKGALAACFPEGMCPIVPHRTDTGPPPVGQEEHRVDVPRAVEEGQDTTEEPLVDDVRRRLLVGLQGEAGQRDPGGAGEYPAVVAEEGQVRHHRGDPLG